MCVASKSSRREWTIFTERREGERRSATSVARPLEVRRVGRRRRLDGLVRGALKLLDAPEELLRIVVEFPEHLLAVSMKLFQDGVSGHSLLPVAPRECKRRAFDSRETRSFSPCGFLKDQGRSDEVEGGRPGLPPVGGELLVSGHHEVSGRTGRQVAHNGGLEVDPCSHLGILPLPPRPEAAATPGAAGRREVGTDVDSPAGQDRPDRPAG